MKVSIRLMLVTGMLLSLVSCVSVPQGPSQLAMPGTNKSFDQFRRDDWSCRDYALTQSGGQSASQRSNASFTQSAVLGTTLGAAIGAAAGGGDGAAIGAGVGAMTGSMAGMSAASASMRTTQRQYDDAYLQCMYGAGHRVPVPANYAKPYVQPSATDRQIMAVPLPPPPPGR